jgi:hypothetical protein
MFDTRFRICFMGPLRCTRQRDNLSPLSSQLQHRLVIVQMAVQQRWSAGGRQGDLRSRMDFQIQIRMSIWLRA